MSVSAKAAQRLLPLIKPDYIPSVPILTTFREGTSDLIPEESLFLSGEIASQLSQKLAEQGGEA
jgi:hypothetical protein